MENDTAKKTKSEHSYSLKKQKLKKWIYSHNRTQPYVAKALNMCVSDFKGKLNRRETFTREQIRSLVYLMGAMEAFKVLYFPTQEERQRVYNETFRGINTKAKESNGGKR